MYVRIASQNFFKIPYAHPHTFEMRRIFQHGPDGQYDILQGRSEHFTRLVFIELRVQLFGVQAEHNSRTHATSAACRWGGGLSRVSKCVQNTPHRRIQIVLQVALKFCESL